MKHTQVHMYTHTHTHTQAQLQEEHHRGSGEDEVDHHQPLLQSQYPAQKEPTHDQDTWRTASLSDDDALLENSERKSTSPVQMGTIDSAIETSDCLFITVSNKMLYLCFSLAAVVKSVPVTRSGFTDMDERIDIIASLDLELS